MKEVNALRLRNHIGEIIEELNETGEPVLISKARKIRAVLITPDQYERRFLDYQADEKKKKLLAGAGKDGREPGPVRRSGTLCL